MAAIDSGLQLPDSWQREAVAKLREGNDVVVSAPTGAGKTYVFELLIQGGWRGQAVYTVPTRALANDKLLEWRRRGWNVGIVTGDVTDRPDAPVVVATLETQRGRMLRGEGPSLLVIDEYQLIADPVRGAHYELALALAPANTRLLLLSGSVANPHDIVAWLTRLGRPAALVRTDRRPVPLEEVFAEALPGRVPDEVRGFWPRIAAKALASDLGPLLLFAPQRKTAETLARQIAAAVPCVAPLFLDPAQRQLAGPELARLLERRVAYHHSGLTYAQRAQLVEPLAKAGKLRVVVATTGLAAGINFSLRTVCVTEADYMTDNLSRRIEPDALLQMFGRAGRRGLDPVGHVLVVPDRPRLTEARPRRLKHSGRLDWPSLIAVMAAAVDRGESPFAAAQAFALRLYRDEPPLLGVEWSLAHADAPCGLASDEERARTSQSTPLEMLGPEGWLPAPDPHSVPLANTLARDVEGRWVPALSLPATLARFTLGNHCRLDAPDPSNPRAPRPRVYGRRATLATCDETGHWRLAPVVRALCREGAARNEPGGPPPLERAPRDVARLRLWLEARLAWWAPGGRIAVWEQDERTLCARVDYSAAVIDARALAGTGVALVEPELRRETPTHCRLCGHRPECSMLQPSRSSPAAAWRRLGLIDAQGIPTWRGRLFSHFIHGEGLAVAAALDDASYPVEDILYDLAALRAGSRFSAVSERADRLAAACRQRHERLTYPGYLQDGLPEAFGHGAGEWMRQLVRMRGAPLALAGELTHGDLERCRLEWRSLLQHCTRLPAHLHPRLPELADEASRMLGRIGGPGAA